MRRKVLLAAAAFLFVATFCSGAFADVTGSVRGTIRDSSGAVVQNATVVLTNPHTGLNRSTKTSGDGAYQFLTVPVGEDYQVEVSAGGFEKSSTQGIRLLVNQVYVGDYQLTIGSQVDTISVTAPELQIETTSNQLGDVIGAEKMTDLPLNGRNFTDLLGLQPGVVPQQSEGTSFASRFFNVNPAGTSGAGTVSVNGGRETSNQFIVNGADVEESFSNGTAVEPNLDSIQEFRILTNTYDAEYGRFSGAIVNILTKSGTNSFHGSAFEFWRNNVLNAHNYIDQPGTPKADFKRNQFGGTVGGPIVKNRLFFFTDFQGWHETRGNPQITDVPSIAEYAGNFSGASAYTQTNLVGTVTGNPSPVPGAIGMDQVLTQRLGYTVNSGEPYWTPGCNTLADSQAGKCVFYGQQIPQAAWSPAAIAILQKGFFKQANGIDPQNGYPAFITNSYPNRLRDYKFGQKIDLSTQSWGNFGLYYFRDKNTDINPFASASVPGFPATTPSLAQNLSLRNTRTIGLFAANEASVAYTRFTTPGAVPTNGLGPFSSFGFVSGGLGLVPAVPQYEGLPQIQLSRGENIGVTNADGRYDNTFSAMDTFSKIVGKHNLKFGGQYRSLAVIWRLKEQYNGVFHFNGSETNNDFADFLIGAPGGFNQAAPAKLDSSSKYGGLFAQDAFQLRPNLTLNYGLRWEVDTPWADKQNRIQTFLFGTQSKIYPDAPQGYVFPGDPGVPKGLSPVKWDKFAPRFGFAYSPDASNGFLGKLFGGAGQTSIRAGAGLYYNAYEQIVNYWELGDPPFGLYYGSNPPVYLEQPYAARSGPNPGQRFPLNYPAPGATGIWSTYQPIGGITGWDPHNTLPYSEQFNLNIQRQIGGSSILTLAYVGTRGHHLITQRDTNPSSPAKCLAVDAAGMSCSGVTYSNGAVTGLDPSGGHGPDFIYDFGNGTVYNGLRQHSVTSGRLLSQGQLDFAEVGHTLTEASSNYNAFETSFQTRFKTLQMLASYTWSRSFDDSSGFVDSALSTGFTWQNPVNPSFSKALSAFDVTHNFVISYNYELPFAKLTGARSGLAYAVLGGWELSGITRFASGFPVYLHSAAPYDPSLCFCGYAVAPDYNGAPIQKVNPRTHNFQYFDTTPFSTPKFLTFGNARHRFFSGPGTNNWDLALHKRTKLTETMALEFRAEFFNVMNHVQFTGADGNISDPLTSSINTNAGKVTGEAPMRIGQLALKLSF